MNDLEKKIANAAQAYYSTGKSDLTDDEFDRLIDELRATKPNSPLLNKVGWGYEVSADSTPGQKFKHIYGTAGSLEKCRTWDEIKSQFKDTFMNISLKLDGLSVVLYYTDGKLHQALTRGDGEYGVDVTDKIKRIPCMTESIADKSFTGAVRGEIVMSFEDFEKYKNIHPEAKNPRNTAVGIINSKEISDDLAYLTVVVYSVVGQETGSYLETIEDVRNWLSKNFDCTVSSAYTALEKPTYEFILGKLKNQWSEVYPSDGLVFTSMKLIHNYDAIIQDSMAFKFKAETAQTEVLEVEWNMSKTGYVVPRIRFNPIELEGTTVQFATGYNAKYVADNKIGVGTIVEIEKRGCIIPNINEVIKVSGNCELPKLCPECNTELQWDGVHLACKNPKCNNTTWQDTMIWTGVLAPVDMLGDNLKQQFFEEIYGKVPTVENLMLDKTNAYTAAPEGTQAYRMRTMLDIIYRYSGFSLKDAIMALNIPRFGTVNAAKLAQYPELVKELLLIAMDGSCADGIKASKLEADLIYTIGKANTESLFANLDKVERLRFIRDRIDWSVAEKPSNSNGKVAITGKLSVKRADFEQELISAGYTPASISKDTKFLITDNPNSSSSKNKKADMWGIVKITEAEFRNKYLK